jgi:cell wall assembly regulator SMI1
MPDEVADSMSEILYRLDRILQTNAPHVLAELQPGLSEIEITQLEDQNNVRLAADVRAIYRWHNGSRQSTNALPTAFLPGHRFVPLDEALAEKSQNSGAKASTAQHAAYRLFAGHRDSWICLFIDGAGDGYWYDPKRGPGQGSVFYNFTETATFLFFPSAKNLMAGVSQCFEQGVFYVKKGSSPPQLDEDFEKAEQIWSKFGASNER